MLLSTLHFHVTSPIFGERIAAILIAHQCLSVKYMVAQIAGVQKEFIAIFKIIKTDTNNNNVNMHDYYNQIIV